MTTTTTIFLGCDSIEINLVVVVVDPRSFQSIQQMIKSAATYNWAQAYMTLVVVEALKIDLSVLLCRSV